MDVFLQRGFDISLRWGQRGAETAMTEGDTLIVIDVLSFSTAVSYAVAAGAVVRPCGHQEDAAAIAEQEKAVLAQNREAAHSAPGAFSLSPATTRHAPPGTRLVLPSPNGAACCAAALSVPLLVIGCLANAQAAAVRATGHGGITVLACGERWKDDDTLRVSVEDYLGAGAVIAGLPGSRSPEAAVCEAAFLAQRDAIPDLLFACASGRELVEKGFREDVELASALDALAVAPIMRAGWLGAE